MTNSTLNTQHSTLAADLRDGLADLEARGLKRQRRVLESPQGARVTVDGREYVAYCSNDYLGLAAHPALVAAAREGAERYGVGAGASHLVLGHGAAHQALEERLAALVELPRALSFSTGYLANLGIVTALAGRGDAVFADRLNHASLNDAALLSRAELKRYPHLDLAALARLLAASRARRKLIVTDAVFSMDGDIAPVPELLALAERHDAWLVLDDAHGFGVLGRSGRGVLSHSGARSPRIVYMATLGKAAGVFGAFAAGAADMVETLVQRARPYVYTTASPPLLAVALIKSLDLVEREEWRRERLWSLIALLRERLRLARWRLAPSATAIQPVVIGTSAEAVAVSEALARDGLLVPAIRPPTVPQGMARLRISLSAAHEPGDVERLAAALNAIAARDAA
ncbi:MAG TPA: 8-amino-7-oxononanoate synthase [Burkholderiales bacterium]|nr:8-amino-7-oxononanoate synthase [Burkholderiales bacterium]